jgi:hypothetical protein
MEKIAYYLNRLKTIEKMQVDELLFEIAGAILALYGVSDHVNKSNPDETLLVEQVDKAIAKCENESDTLTKKTICSLTRFRYDFNKYRDEFFKENDEPEKKKLCTQQEDGPQPEPMKLRDPGTSSVIGVKPFSIKPPKLKNSKRKLWRKGD